MASEKLLYEKKTAWRKDNKEKVFAFAEGYKEFLNNCKTERLSVDYTVELLEKAGFKTIEAGGSRVYKVFKSKSIAFAILGNASIQDGVNVIASHIDSPRVDLKQNPFYESDDVCMAKTHYYGGIKKYQWLSTPLALHGVVMKTNGEKVKIDIGENPSDPVFVIPDLLPHLSRKVQYAKKLTDAFDANKMNLVFSSMPAFGDDDKDIKSKFKLRALELLSEKYEIKEQDFLSAELSLVPAGLARDAGLDASMILSYGQDDRVCSYCGLRSVLDLEANDKTVVCYFADKEEIGSDGNTGAKSAFFKNFIQELMKLNGESYDSYSLGRALTNSQIISADVSAALNPNYQEVHDKQNATILGSGVEICKFGGGGGKYSSSDASSEFTSKLIRIFEKNGISWQMGGLGKVDEGGGGTIAKYLAELGADVIDCGTGLFGMHSLYELSSKVDVYNTYLAYLSFLREC